ncbi:MAG: hypothetical protein C0595_05155 [Marinilabiliales bacterium]|nr:MAG: hypothetical protein C0595_05155 [Marinilabiliales bacterium]
MIKLLAIDDNKNNLLALKALLEDLLDNCIVLTAQSAIEGIEMAKKNNPDTIILDVIMPELDGFQTCKILKSDKATESIPVILLTALMTDTNSKIKGLEAGAEAFIAKPIDTSELIAQTRAMIRIKQAEDKLRIKKQDLEHKVINQAKKLDDTDRDYKNILENIGEGIGKLDEKNNFTYINARGAEIFGYPKQTLLKEKLKNILSKDMYKTVMQQTSMTKPGKSAKFYIKTITKKGVEKTLFVTAMPEFDNEGNYLGASGIFRDVTKVLRDEKLLSKQFELAKISSATNNIKLIAKALLEFAIDAEDLDSGGVYMRDKMNRKFKLVTSMGISDDFLKAVSSFDFSKIQQQMSERKDMFYCMFNDLPLYKEIKVNEGLKAVGIVPITHNDSSIAILIVASHKFEEISEDTKQSVNYLTAQLNSAFKRIIVEQENIANIAKYKSLVEGTKDAILTIRKGIITDCNQALCIMLGYKSKSAFIGKSPLNFTTNEIIGGINPTKKGIEAIEETLKNNFYEFEWILKKSNGELFWVEARLSLFSTGNQRFISVILRDLSIQKEREEEIRKFKTITDEAHYGCAMTNLEGQLIYLNKAFADMHSYKIESLLNKNIKILQGNSPNSNLNELINQLREKEYLESTEVWNSTKDGKQFPALLNGMLIKDENNTPSYISYTIIDISELKQYELDIREALSKAEESDKLKAAFLASISHELRTPLNAVIGFSQLLSSDLEDEEVDLYSSLIYESGLHLKEIVDDIFYFTMVKSGQEKLNLSKINPSLLIAEVHKLALDIKDNSKKEDINVKLELPEEKPFLISDNLKIIHVFKQLIRNAIKFTKKGEIKIGFKAENKDSIIFFVKDTGIGIPEEKIDIIFEFFRQAYDALSRQYEGTGMGLALTKKLLEMLNGEIWVESQVNTGSSFYFKIPLKPDNNEEVNYQ